MPHLVALCVYAQERKGGKKEESTNFLSYGVEESHFSIDR